MAMQTPYKNRRSARTSLIETDFSKGMMYTDNNVDDGYVKTMVNFDFENDNRVLTPRAGLRTKEIIFPDFTFTEQQQGTDFIDDDVTIQAVKECVEDGSEYHQIILGLLDEDNAGEGQIWMITSDSDTRTFTADETLDIDVNLMKFHNTPKRCKFFESDLSQIHNMKLAPNRKVSQAIGTFGFLNSYYFFGIDTVSNVDVTSLYHTVFDTSIPSGASSPYDRYVAEKVEVKELTASEAVNYGYNMLDSDPYTFSDGLGGSSVFQMEGILPYDSKFTSSSEPKLLMSPKHNTKIWFRCNYDVPADTKYKIVWSWKELSADEWTVFSTDDNFTVAAGTTDLPVIQADLIPPSSEIMVRCEAYKWDSEASAFEDAVERAMTVGFDFTINQTDSSNNMDQEIYDLTTAQGMCFYKNRLVLHGLPKDPSILFISDYNEPGYFPYPNNIVTFDEPIIHTIEFMDSLIVFTVDKIYQVSYSSESNSWNSQVVQSHLYIEPYDKHLVRTVRNMLYFKSGNYYYMMVPKKYSDTGELTLAPITTPITQFFDNFSSNVTRVLKDTYGRNDVFELVNYYNFLDYEYVHNIYVFTIDSLESMIHFDIMYNTNSRYWKVCVYENPACLFPFRNDATQYGLLASTSVNNFDAPSTSSDRDGRIIQIFKFDKNYPKDFFIPSDAVFTYYPDRIEPSVETKKLVLPGLATVTNKLLSLDNAIVDLPVIGKLLKVTGSAGYYKGFKVDDLDTIFQYIIENYDDYFTYRNYQFIDTGYTSEDFAVNKRFREVQMQINNSENNDLIFSMDFLVAGEPRKVVYKYEVNHLIDELDSDFGIVDIDSVPYFEVDADDVDLSNFFTIENNLYPQIDFWKLRANVTGKGVSPRLRLNSRNENNFQILSLAWVYRLMNMR